MTVSKTVKQWLKYARTDIKMAKASLELSSEYKNGAAFLAQQCAEKAIKGYLAFMKVRFPKTHNMAQLLAEVEKINPHLAKTLSKSKSLTAYAVTYRYPDAERKPLTVAKAKIAITVAEKVLVICLDEISSIENG